MPAIFRRAHRAPGNAVAGAVEAAERTLQPRHVGQQGIFRHLDTFHDDLAGDRGAKRQLAADLRRGQSLHALFEHEAADFVVMGVRLGPDDEDVGDRRVRDPGLGAGQPIAAVDLLGAGLHAGGIGAGIRLGQAEAADESPAGEFRQIFLALLLGAVGVDRIHHQRGLDAHHRAVAGIDPLDLAGDEAVGDVGGGRAAVFLGQRHAEQAEFAHFIENGPIGLLLAIGLDDARLEFFLRIGARGIADHPLVVGQQVLDEKRILPYELRNFLVSSRTSSCSLL